MKSDEIAVNFKKTFDAFWIFDEVTSDVSTDVQSNIRPCTVATRKSQSKILYNIAYCNTI